MADERDYAAIARRYRDQAEEFRVRGSLMADPNTRAQYDNLADTFEKLADNEERAARNTDRAAE